MDKDQYEYNQGDYDEYNYNDNNYNQGYAQNQYYIEQQEANEYHPFSNFKEYEVLPYNALFLEVSKHLKTANQMICLPEGWCLLLLRQFKWDIDLLTQYFTNMDKYKNKIHFKDSYKNPNDQIAKTLGLCQVCYIQDYLYQNICGHAFCRNCWNQHLQTLINANNSFPKCMACQCPILYQTIITFLKTFNQEDRKLLDRYQKNICQLFSTIHRNYQFCTGADCNNCIKVYNLNLQTVRCTCGKSFCFKCKSDDHSPCTCEDKKQWVENVLKQEADAKWMAVNTKLCPWCKKAVQRSAGCNFMACVCGKSFCYLCSRPWQPDHKDHFKCHIYKKSSTQTVNRQKEILQKMNFYTQRYLDNQAIGAENKKIDNFQKRKSLFKLLNIDLSDSQFIDSAYKFSIQCCQSLKWIYAYSYYAKWKNQNQKTNFEFYQGQFEKYKVNLLKLLAVDLKNFMKEIQKMQTEKKLTQEKKAQYVDRFKHLKMSIVNYYTMTKQYKQRFVEQIENRQQETVLVKKKSQVKQKQKQKQKKGSQKQKQKQKDQEWNNSGRITRSDKKKEGLKDKLRKAFS